MTKIRVTAGSVEVEAELNDTATAARILAALPIRAKAQTWGDEIYFSIPVHEGEDNGRAVVDVGDLAYWPPGSAFCIFFGPTPASAGSECRAASPVNVVGRVLSDPSVLKKVRSGEPVVIELYE